MTTISITIDDLPSRSKGWGRYSVTDAGRAVVESNTRNPWVSAPHSGEVAQGAEFELSAQVMLRVGPSKREEIRAKTFALIAEDGAVAKINYKPGSQGIALTVQGARLAQ